MLPLHGGGQVRLVGDVEEDREDADHGREHVELGHPEEARKAEGSDRTDEDPAAEVPRDEHGTPPPPVHPDAHEEAEEQERERPRDPQEAHLACIRAEAEDRDDRDREARELVPEPGDALADSKEQEVAVPPKTPGSGEGGPPHGTSR